MQTSFKKDFCFPLGPIAQRVFVTLDDSSRGLLIKRLLRWFATGDEPTDLPENLTVLWIALTAEVEILVADLEETAAAAARVSDARSKAAKKRWKNANDAKRCKTMQNGNSDAKSVLHMQSDANDTTPLPSPLASSSPDPTTNLPPIIPQLAQPDVLEPINANTAPACEEASCPLDEDTIRVTASHIGMPDGEVEAWRDYYTAAQWRFRPADPRVMTKAAALASLKRWHTNEGIRAARQEHIDAKMDERHQQTLAARAANTASFVESEEAARRRKEQEAADLAKAKQLMNW